MDIQNRVIWVFQVLIRVIPLLRPRAPKRNTLVILTYIFALLILQGL